MLGDDRIEANEQYLNLILSIVNNNQAIRKIVCEKIYNKFNLWDENNLDRSIKIINQLIINGQKIPSNVISKLKKIFLSTNENRIAFLILDTWIFLFNRSHALDVTILNKLQKNIIDLKEINQKVGVAKILNYYIQKDVNIYIQNKKSKLKKFTINGLSENNSNELAVLCSKLLHKIFESGEKLCRKEIRCIFDSCLISRGEKLKRIINILKTCQPYFTKSENQKLQLLLIEPDNTNYLSICYDIVSVEKILFSINISKISNIFLNTAKSQDYVTSLKCFNELSNIELLTKDVIDIIYIKSSLSTNKTVKELTNLLFKKIINQTMDCFDNSTLKKVKSYISHFSTSLSDKKMLSGYNQKDNFNLESLSVISCVLSCDIQCVINTTHEFNFFIEKLRSSLISDRCNQKISQALKIPYSDLREFLSRSKFQNDNKKHLFHIITEILLVFSLSCYKDTVPELVLVKISTLMTLGLYSNKSISLYARYIRKFDDYRILRLVIIKKIINKFNLTFKDFLTQKKASPDQSIINLNKTIPSILKCIQTVLENKNKFT